MAETPEETPETTPATEAEATEATATEEASPTEEAPKEEAKPAAPTGKTRREKLDERRSARRKTRAQMSPEERAAERKERRVHTAAERRRYRTRTKAKRAEQRESQPAAERDHAREHGPGRAKVRQGIVVSDKADKTITVRIDVVGRHRRYHKIMRTSIKLHAHDEVNDAGTGDTVRIQECRPMSRSKRWRLIEVLERAK